jgi:hypothetical protein
MSKEVIPSPPQLCIGLRLGTHPLSCGPRRKLRLLSPREGKVKGQLSEPQLVRLWLLNNNVPPTNEVTPAI